MILKCIYSKTPLNAGDTFQQVSALNEIALSGFLLYYIHLYLQQRQQIFEIIKIRLYNTAEEKQCR